MTLVRTAPVASIPVEYASRRRIRERNKLYYRFNHWPIWVFVLFIAPGPLTFDLFERGRDGRIDVWLFFVLATTAVAGLFGRLPGTEARPLIVRFIEDRPNPLHRRVCYTLAWSELAAFTVLNVAGLLVAASGEALCFAVNGITKLGVIAAVAVMKVEERPRAPRGGHVMADLVDGLRYAWDTVPVRILLPTLAMVSFMIAPYQALMPIFAAEIFHGGAETLGYLMGAAGLGGEAFGLIGEDEKAGAFGSAEFVGGGDEPAGGAEPGGGEFAEPLGGVAEERRVVFRAEGGDFAPWLEDAGFVVGGHDGDGGDAGGGGGGRVGGR